MSLALVALTAFTVLPVSHSTPARDDTRSSAVDSSALVAPASSIPLPPRDGPRIAPPRIGPAPLPLGRAAFPADTDRTAPVEYSDWYYRRLTIHRWGSYTMLPLFAAQYIVGSQLYRTSPGGSDGPKDAHEMLAVGVATLFASNTVTGLWNLWDGRRDPNERGRRLTHATLMLLADAGFVTTGILADGIEDGGTGSGRSTHRAVAITSFAISTTGWLLMTDLFRKE